MKKVYINPTIEIVKVTTCNMIATSIQDAVTETKLDPNATTSQLGYEINHREV